MAVDKADGLHAKNVIAGEPACFACLDSDGERRSNATWRINHGREGVTELSNGDLLVYDPNCTFTSEGRQVTCTSAGDRIGQSVVVFLVGECK